MAGWISSKLKVAENLLQQIDNQAAESLRHGETKPSDDFDLTSSPKSSTSVSLKDQLKKKESPKSNQGFGKLVGDSSGKKIGIHVTGNDVSGKQKLDSGLPSTINDGDWTELLSTPNLSPIAHSSGASSRGGVRRGGRNVGKGRKVGDGNGEKAKINVGGGQSDEHESKKSFSTARVSGYGNREKGMEKLELVEDFGIVTHMVGNKEKVHESNNIVTHGKLVRNPDGMGRVGENVPDQGSSKGNEGDFDEKYMGKATKRMSNHNVDVVEYVSKALKGNSHMGRDHETDSDSDSGSDSSSTSNSEVEREREEQRQIRREILAAKAAAKVSEAIKEQENVVARLEGEKQSLEKILEEWAKQAHQEASKLQSTMIETMEAADLEKQKHNHTRMELLARLAKLETANADLAKSVANAQWNIEVEVTIVTVLRRQVDAKELVHEELKRQIYNIHKKRTSLTNVMPYKGFELEREMLDGECSLLTEKIALLQDKATKLEGDIDVLMKEEESSTEVEVELKRRLRQMTDHLIQKQAQVEALSSEKATLLFRTEAVLKLLDESKSQTNGLYTSRSSVEDLEGVTFELTGPHLRTLQHKIQSGKQHLGSLVRQLDAIFYAGSLFLARNPAAKLWSLMYLVCLHLWVLYILFSHSQSTENSISSSVVSLENINNSVGV